LLLALAVAILTGWLISAFDARQSAREARDQMAMRLGRAHTQYAQQADMAQIAKLADLRKQLDAMSLGEATPAIGRLRMREELIELSGIAGLRNAVIIDEAPDQDLQGEAADQSGIRPIDATLEADFDWPALVALIGEAEIYPSAYLIQGIALSDDGEAHKLRITFRILHRTQGAKP
jgi:hypothetical protein